MFSWGCLPIAYNDARWSSIPELIKCGIDKILKQKFCSPESPAQGDSTFCGGEATGQELRSEKCLNPNPEKKSRTYLLAFAHHSHFAQKSIKKNTFQMNQNFLLSEGQVGARLQKVNPQKIKNCLQFCLWLSQTRLRAFWHGMTNQFEGKDGLILEDIFVRSISQKNEENYFFYFFCRGCNIILSEAKTKTFQQ